MAQSASSTNPSTGRRCLQHQLLQSLRSLEPLLPLWTCFHPRPHLAVVPQHLIIQLLGKTDSKENTWLVNFCYMTNCSKPQYPKQQHYYIGQNSSLIAQILNRDLAEMDVRPKAPVLAKSLPPGHRDRVRQRTAYLSVRKIGKQRHSPAPSVSNGG